MTDPTNNLSDGFSRLMTHCVDHAEKGFNACLANGKSIVRLDVSDIKYAEQPEEQLRCRSISIKQSLMIAAIAIAILITVSVVPASGNGSIGYTIMGVAGLVALTHLKEAFIEHLARRKELETFIEEGGDANNPLIDITFQELMRAKFVNALGLNNDDSSSETS